MFDIAFAIVPGLILFLYGIDNFSREIQKIAGENFRLLLARATSNRLIGSFLGAIVTSIIQSSTATTVIVVGLVGSGVLSFSSSLGVIIGANVGTTITAQLVALKLTYLSPIFILGGFLISFFGRKYRFLGKPIFYFGLVFFSLELISGAIEPYQSDPWLVSVFSNFDNLLIALAGGFLFTLLVQSSSVTTGLVVILVGSGLLTVENGIPVIMGANIGTTITSLIASSGLDIFAKRSAVAHFIFNVVGVLIFLPVIPEFTSYISSFDGAATMQMANAHLVFNLVSAVIFLLILPYYEKLIITLVPGSEKEVVFRTRYFTESLPPDTREAIDQVKNEIKYSLEVSGELFSNVRRYLETSDRKYFHQSSKLESFSDFLDKEITKRLSDLSLRELGREDAENIILLSRISNNVEELGDTAKRILIDADSLHNSGMLLSEESIGTLSDAFDILEDGYSQVRSNFPKLDKDAMKRDDRDLSKIISKGYSAHMRMIRQKNYAGAYFVSMIHDIESASLILRKIRKLSEDYSNL